MIARPPPCPRSLRRPLAAGVGAFYLALAILAHFAHEAPARAAMVDPLGLGAPICWGAQDASDAPDGGRDAPVCEACLLAKSLAAPPPASAGVLAAPSSVAAAPALARLDEAPAPAFFQTPPARGPPALS